MKIVIAVLTYNRKALFEKTMNSLAHAGYPFIPVVIDNGSTDGTAEAAKASFGNVIINNSGDHSTGYGMNLAIEEALRHKPDLILFSADDFEYKKYFLHELVNFWSNAPADVIMASCYLEPLWDWNKVISKGKAGQTRYVLRESIPGSNWSFMANSVNEIYPVAQKTGGEDLAICAKLRRQRYRLAALDLVIHTGEEQSAWGNQSYKYAQPINKKELGFAEWT